MAMNMPVAKRIAFRPAFLIERLDQVKPGRTCDGLDQGDGAELFTSVVKI